MEAVEAVVNVKSTEELASKTSIRSGQWKMNNYMRIGGFIIAVFVLVALIAPLLSPDDPNAIIPKNRLAPIGTAGHFLGTDHLGRDLLSRLIWGSRISLEAGIGAAAIAMLLGVTIGIAAGMNGKLLDNVLMRVIDILLSFPAILLAILVVAFMGPSLKNAMFAVALVNIPFYARLTRSVTLSVKQKEYIEASFAIGNSYFKTILRHIVPNISPYIISQTMMNIGWMIMETTSLSFLGLGVQPPTSDWGSMLGEARTVMLVAPMVVALPGLCIFIVVFGFNMLGDGLRDWFDPHSNSNRG
jgi:peptide/nickel transport system permease protein